jgi:DNA-binding beta-propeller fold protein YncE
VGESSGRRSVWAKFLSVYAGLAFGLMIAFVPMATADEIVCEPGTGAAQCSSPTGVAVDRKEGLLYVADNGNRRVDVFDADTYEFLRAFGWDVAPEGAPGDTVSDQFEICSTACKAGVQGSSLGQFGSMSGIAVDNDELSPALGDVYVLDGGNRRVQRFHSSGEFVLAFGTAGSGKGQFEEMVGIGVGPGGTVYIADAKSVGPCKVLDVGGNEFEKRVQTFDPLGVPVDEIKPTDAPCGAMKAFAVDSSGDFYLANVGASGAVRKYDPSGVLLATFHASFNIQTLAVDAADNLFVGDSSGSVDEGGETAVYQYDAAGNPIRTFYGDGTLQARPVSLAPYQNAMGDIFAAEGSGGLGRVVHVAFPPPGPIVHPAPGLTEAKPIGNTWATLNARVNPEGKASTYYFEYVDDATYDANLDGGGSGFDGAAKTPETAVVPPAKPNPAVNPLFVLAFVSAQIGCPEPTEELFEEGKCLVPETVYHFRVVAKNAGGEETGPEASFETKRPVEIGDAWSSEVGADAALVHAEVNPLNIPTHGRFEYVKEASFEASGFAEASLSAEIDLGSGEEFVTASVQLHSLKAGTAYRYRIVVENEFGFEEAGDVRTFRTFSPEPGPPPCPNDAFRGSASAKLPDCRAYEMVSAIEKESAEVTLKELTQSAAQVPAAGKGFTYSTYGSFGDAISTPYSTQYMASRRPDTDGEYDAQDGWHSHAISPQREGAAYGSLIWLNTQYKAFSEDLGQAWLRSDSEPRLDMIAPAAIAGFPNLYRRENATETYEAICPAEPPSQEAGDYVLELQGFSQAGDVTVFRANDALSEEAAPNAGTYQLYGCRKGELRVLGVLPGGEVNEGHSSAGTHQSAAGDYREDSVHNAMADDGSRLYWTDSGGVSTGQGKIYLRKNPFAEGGECDSEATPCTVEVSEAVEAPGSEDKAHFWTASPDGSVAIFSFTAGPLSGNLYEFEAETGTATLIAEGVSGVAGFSEDAQRHYLVSTKALAEGASAGQPNLYLHEGADFKLVAAFPDGIALGGYCKIDDQIPNKRCSRATPDGLRLAFMSGAKLSEYDNEDAASGKPDAEVYLYDATAEGGKGALLCVSCNPSGGRPAGRGITGGSGTAWIAAELPSWQSAFHAPRLLSADGRRLFFESTDSLVLGDTNGTRDVYQWEEAGKGNCEAGDSNHFPQNGGCISLISSGKSPEDSDFVDASADGQDVFLATSSSLLAQDPGVVDIYDARVEGGFPPLPVPKPACEGEACQSPPAPPQAPVPSSANFRGPQESKPCLKGKRKVRKPGRKARCVKKLKGAKKKGKRVQGKGPRR